MNLSITLEQPGKKLALFGSADRHLRLLREAFAVQIVNRDDELRVSGEPEPVQRAARVLDQMQKRLRRQDWLSIEDVTKAIGSALDADRARGGDEVEVFAKGGAVRAKTAGQKVYLDAIFANDLTICTGPAGTGKTYLAVAAAAALLRRGAAKRLVLARPAVEAGERLGFLPGDLQAKVNPYLRPLFDALNDMMDFEQVKRFMVNDVIEVVPLAFMRGRAQPLTSQVLTPFGFRDIGSISVGDLVIGSDGQPTRVLGYYPQGTKDVFRVTFTDGSSTRCCGEHLWTVTTPAAGTLVLEAQQIRARLRREAFAVPMLSSPVEFASPSNGLSTVAAHRRGYVWGDISVGTTDNRKGRQWKGYGDPGGTATIVGAGFGAELLHAPPDVRLAAVQGLMDAGGSVGNRASPLLTFASGAARVGRDLDFLVRSLGGLTRPDAAQPLARVVELPPGIQPFRLTQKAAAYAAAAAVRPPARFIESIEPDGSDECVCIRVAAADALYVTDHFILTHNTLSDSVIILDEAQNTTVSQMLMFLTRLGHDSKMIVTGDATQVDLPDGTPSGLADAVRKLRGIAHVGLVELDQADIVRHRLVQTIVSAYERAGQPIHRGDVEPPMPTLPL